MFTVKNRDGDVVRQVTGPAEAGFHRVSWDLRYPVLEPWSPEPETPPGEAAGVLVVPGTFTVEMHKRIDGVLEAVGEPRSFNVASIRPESVLPGTTQGQRVVFESQVDELRRTSLGTVASIDEIVLELDAVKVALGRAATTGSLYEIANSIQQRIKAARDRLANNPSREIYNDFERMSVASRLWHARFAQNVGAYGPTPEQQESLRIARTLYDDVVAELTELVDTEYAALKSAMDAAKVPWTPGRGIQH